MMSQQKSIIHIDTLYAHLYTCTYWVAESYIETLLLHHIPLVQPCVIHAPGGIMHMYYVYMHGLSSLHEYGVYGLYIVRVMVLVINQGCS